MSATTSVLNLMKMCGDEKRYYRIVENECNMAEAIRINAFNITFDGGYRNYSRMAIDYFSSMLDMNEVYEGDEITLYKNRTDLIDLKHGISIPLVGTDIAEHELLISFIFGVPITLIKDRDNFLFFIMFTWQNNQVKEVKIRLTDLLITITSKDAKCTIKGYDDLSKLYFNAINCANNGQLTIYDFKN